MITRISILMLFLRMVFTLYREMLKDTSVAVGRQTRWPLTLWSFSGWHARLLLVFCTFTNTITFTGEDPLTFGLFPAYWFSWLFFTPSLSGRPALVSPGNNILVLPEYMSQTPASVILLLGEHPLLNKHLQLFVSHPWGKCEMTLQTSFVILSWKFANERSYKWRKHCSTLSCSQWPGPKELPFDLRAGSENWRLWPQPQQVQGESVKAFRITVCYSDIVSEFLLIQYQCTLSLC